MQSKKRAGYTSIVYPVPSSDLYLDLACHQAPYRDSRNTAQQKEKTADNHTGIYNLSVFVENEVSLGESKPFYYEINATNDAPNFTVINESYILSQDQLFYEFINSSDEISEEHYPLNEEWARGVFDKAKSATESQNKKFEYNNHLEYGKFIQDSLKEFIKETPVVAMVIKGPHAIEIVRKMVGPTEPRKAAPGTIRGDYSHHTYALADAKKIALRNLIHASADEGDAKRELELWFTEEEMHTYKTVHDVVVQ